MKLHNTLSREKQELQTLDKNKVKLYTCGLTVYSHPHIGNWVSYIYWDLLVRVLRHDGYEVEHVQNITDVGHLTSDDDSGEDKLEKGAKAEGLTAWEVAEKYAKIADKEAYEDLKLSRPNLIKATDCIDKQIEFLKILEEKGFTYTIECEGVYFDTSKLSDYGKLARLDKSGLLEGARVEVAGKCNPTDFALWKFSPEGSKRDMEWDSPWGKGFPGWHLECSVIAKENLGDQIDIHTGGIDHIAVHHTNEIAQTETLTGKPFSTFWLHSNHIKVNGTKMSKSLGNVYTLEDIKSKGFDVQAFKLMVLSKHFQTEGNFTWEILEAANNRLKNWQKALDRVWQFGDSLDGKEAANEALEHIRDNLDSPNALRVIDEYLNKLENTDSKPSEYIIEIITDILGLSLQTEDASKDLYEIIEERQRARADKNWEESDVLRSKAERLGFGIKDQKDKQVWFRI